MGATPNLDMDLDKTEMTNGQQTVPKLETESLSL